MTAVTGVPPGLLIGSTSTALGAFEELLQACKTTIDMIVIIKFFRRIYWSPD